MNTRLFIAVSACITISTVIAQPHSETKKTNIFYVQKGNGTPSVVFVSGMAHDHKTWQIIQDSLSPTTTTISYDRAGLGESPLNGQSKDLASMAQELNMLLQNAHVDEPAILVGHSMGCQIIKMFASRHPEKVAGVVFIDPGYDEDVLRSRISDSLWHERDAAIKKYQPQFNAGQKSEENAHQQIAKDADNITKFPKVPVVMFTATMITQFPGNPIEQQVKKERHELWLKQMPQAKHIFVSKSWHYIHVDAPEEVIREIRAMVTMVRRK
jgi:alpha-beta hydrolase superfamily lysophospholipase